MINYLYNFLCAKTNKQTKNIGGQTAGIPTRDVSCFHELKKEIYVPICKRLLKEQPLSK